MKVKTALSDFFIFIFLWQLFFNNVDGVRIPPVLFWPAFAICLFAYWLGLDRKKLFFPKGTSFFSVGMVYIVISGFFSGIVGYAGDALYTVFRLALYFVSMIMVVSFVRFRRDWIAYVSKVAFTLALIHAFFVYLEFLAPSVYFAVDFQGWEHTKTARDFMQAGAYVGLPGQTSDTAMSLCIGLIFSLYLFYLNLKSGKKWWVLLGQLILLTSIFLTQRRMTTGLACVVFAYEFLVFFNGRTKALGVLFLMLFLLFFGWEAIPGLESVLGKMDRYVGMGTVTSGRTVLWAKALTLFFNSPLFGSGWGAYVTEFGGGFAGAAHNSFLQLLGELGLIGFVCFFSYHIICLYYFIRLFFRKNFNPGVRAITACFFGYWYVSCFFEGIFYDTEAVCFLLLVELIVQYAWKNRKSVNPEEAVTCHKENESNGSEVLFCQV